MTRRLFTLAILLASLADAGLARGKEKEPSPGDLLPADLLPADLLPATTAGYLEIREPRRFLEAALSHPLRERLEAFPKVQAAVNSQAARQLLASITVLEAEFEQRWPELLDQACGRGAVLAVDARTEGVVLLFKERDAETLERLATKFAQLARRDAQRKNRPDPTETVTYRDVTVYKTGSDWALTAKHGWLLVTNKERLGKWIVDQILDADQQALAQDEQFQQAQADASQEAAAWGYVNVTAVREAGIGRSVSQSSSGNPLAELLIGGILANLQNTPYATGSLAAGDRQLRLELAVPHQVQWAGSQREYYFGADGKGAAPPLLEVRHRLLAASFYRHLSQFWLGSDALFNQRVNDRWTQADSNLSTLFSGKDFGRDILAKVQPGVQLVLARQEFADGSPQPEVKLPALALVMRLQRPEVSGPEFRRVFQSLVGFINVMGAMNGQPQLDLGMETGEDWQLVTATYLLEPNADPQQLPIPFNFSPSLGFAGDRWILASTRELARELAATQGQADHREAAETVVNAAAALDGRVLHRLLDDNREPLIAQNLLKAGLSREEALEEIQSLLNLLAALRGGNLKLTVAEDRLRVLLTIKL